ncbi:hypothetical protein [Nitrosomonas sp.]|uniref:hypothetical protein n=1 Tax=Nitrosomonas sp. TaxID=42353 RepID=UPI002611D2CC|nr:hypothetical protein [Nitrosomonas sp.]MCW5602585.1 hypothetical protein [Nitrosomonas sp.]
MMLRLGRVVAIHPEDNSVDILMTDDGARLAGVQVLASVASTRSGLVDLPIPAQPHDEDAKWDIAQATEEDVIAAVAYFDAMRMPVVVGFLYPQINQILFAEKGRKIDRHESDVYSTITLDGDTEWYHPSGTYIRVGVSPAHEDLTAKDFDGKWQINRNIDKAVHVQLTVKNAGSQVASLNIDPDGNITLENIGNLSIHAGGTMQLESEGNMTLTAPRIDLNP